MLFDEVLVSPYTLAKKDSLMVVDTINELLDEGHFNFLVKFIKRQLPILYPRIDATKWQILDSYFTQKLYRESILAVFEIVEDAKFGTKNVYTAIANSWQAMNGERYRRGIIALPHHNKIPDVVIKTEQLDFITVNGNRYPEPEDIANAGTFLTIKNFLGSTEDLHALSDVMQQITFNLFVIISENGFADAGDEEILNETEQSLGRHFHSLEFHAGMDILEMFISHDDNYMDALNDAISAAFGFYNTMFEVSGSFRF